MSESVRIDIYDRTLRWLREENDEWHRVIWLGRMAAELPAPLLPEAVQTIQQLRAEGSRSYVIQRFAPRMSSEQAKAFFDDAMRMKDGSARAAALEGLAPILPGTSRNQALSEALKSSRRLEDTESLNRLVAVLIPHTSDDLRERIFARACEIEDDARRSDALLEILPLLPVRLLDRALSAAREIITRGPRATALAGMVGRLPAPTAEEVAQECLGLLREIESDLTLWFVVLRTADHLKGADRVTAVRIARKIGKKDLQKSALEALGVLHDSRPAPATRLEDQTERLDPDAVQSVSVAEASRLFEDILIHEESKEFSATRLAVIAPRLSEAQRMAALENIVRVEDEFAKGTALIGFLPHLKGNDRARCLEEGLSLKAESARFAVIEGFAPFLSDVEIQQVFSSILSHTDDPRLERSLEVLMPRMVTLAKDKPELAHGEWSKAMRTLSLLRRSLVFGCLEAILPMGLELGGKNVADQLHTAVYEVTGWWP